MTVSPLFNAIRALYVDLLAQAADVHQHYVEPAFRNRDGFLATEGALSLPCRADLIGRGGLTAGTSMRVDSTSKLKFEPLAFEIGATIVHVSPFAWDWMLLAVHGVNNAAAELALRSWFIRWFDVDDANPTAEDGLQGVLHFMSELTIDPSGWTVTIDGGSAPARAVEELLICLSDAGATRIRLG